MRSMIQETQTRTLSLIAHPACAVPSAWRVSVAFEREATNAALKLRYRLPRFGLRLPDRASSSASPDSSARVDRLWQHTCAELFVAVPGNSAYREFNFAPDNRWAAYDFVDYREPAAGIAQVLTPRISSEPDDDAFCISVRLDAACLPVSKALQFSATVVLEDEEGQLSYWAAVHPGEKPDFHHRDGFVLSLDSQ